MIRIDHRLSLGTITEPISELLFEAIDQNRAHLSCFLPWVGNMKVVEDFKNYMHNSRQLSAAGKELSFAIIFDQIPVGRIGLHHIDLQSKNASIGYWLTKNAQGNGLVIKSCKALLNHGFRELKLQRIEIKAAAKNSRSRAIPESLGFSMEGILRKAEFVNNEFHDVILYSLLEEEWNKSNTGEK